MKINWFDAFNLSRAYLGIFYLTYMMMFQGLR